MPEKIKLALVGVQRWGQKVGQQMAASDLVELAWVYDADAQAAGRAAATWNARAAASLDELLAADVLGAVIITPNHTHAELGLRAAAAGKHAMIVKPLTNTIAEGRDLIAGCRKAGVFLATNHPARKSPLAQHVKRELEAGHFGKLLLVAEVSGHEGGLHKTPDDWRAQRAKAPGGPLIQLTVHTFDTWQFWFGPVVEVQAAGGHRATPGDNDDFFAGQARFADGLIANFATQYACPGSRFSAVHGTEMTIGHDRGGVFQLRARPLSAPYPYHEQQPLKLDDFDGIRRDVEDFARDIRAGRQPHASGEDGLRAVACVHAALRSRDRGGEWVKVDDLLNE